MTPHPGRKSRFNEGADRTRSVCLEATACTPLGPPASPHANVHSRGTATEEGLSLDSDPGRHLL